MPLTDDLEAVCEIIAAVFLNSLLHALYAGKYTHPVRAFYNLNRRIGVRVGGGLWQDTPNAYPPVTTLALLIWRLTMTVGRSSITESATFCWANPPNNWLRAMLPRIHSGLDPEHMPN